MIGAAPVVLPGEVAGLVLCALLAISVGLAALLVGLKLGQRMVPARQREIEAALRQLAAGDYEVTLRADQREQGYPLVRALAELARALRDRHQHRERRLLQVAEAAEGLPGRCLLVADEELLVCAAGDAAARMTEMSPADLEGRPLDELLEGEGMGQLAADLVAARRTRSEVAAPVLLRRERSDPLPVTLRAGWHRSELRPARGRSDRLTVLLEVRDPARENLATRLDRAESVVDGLPLGVMILAAGRVIEANDAARRWLGPQVVSAAAEDLFAAEDLLLAMDRIGRAAAGEETEPFTCRLAPAESARRGRIVEAAVFPVRYDERQAVALTLRDLDREEAADRRASLHEARLLSVFDAVGDGLALLTAPAAAQGPPRVGLLNRGMEDLFDLDASRALGATEEELRALVAHHFAQPAGFAAMAEEAAAQPLLEHRQTFDLVRDERAVEVVVRPVLGREGELLGRIFVARDMTRHRQTERQLSADAELLDRSRRSLQQAYEELIAVHRELGQKTEEMTRLNRELGDLDRTRSTMLADLSHALQAPLVSVRGYTQMILQGRLGPINDEQRRGLEVALGNVDRMTELVGNLLALARAEGAPGPRLEEVSLSGTVEEAMARHRQAAAENGVQLEARLEAPEARVQADPEGLRQVLDNLLSNAIKFTPRGGRVELAVRQGPQGFVALEVRDTGIGIPEDEQEHIFDRFFRGKAAGRVSGSGIGLATVKQVVERHQGAIQCRSEIGRGSVFRVLWPVPATDNPTRRAAAS
jgi:signal transduction histidine kinase